MKLDIFPELYLRGQTVKFANSSR